MESGRSPKWQVAAPASGSEIRDATTSRGWKGRRRNSLRVVPYKTWIHPGREHPASGYAFTSSKNYESAPRYFTGGKGGQLVGISLVESCWINFSFSLSLSPPLSTRVVKSWQFSSPLFFFFYTGQRTKLWNLFHFIKIFDSLFKTWRICNLQVFKEHIQKRRGLSSFY